MDVREKTFSPATPEATQIPPKEAPPSKAPPGSASEKRAGFAFAAAGVVLMTLAFWNPFDPAFAFASALASASGGASVISGGVGDDELYGEAGPDLIVAGEGDDFVEATGGGRDHIHCGAGDDLVNADYSDVVSADCETVYRS